MYHKGIFNAGTLKVRGVKRSSCVRVPLLILFKSSVFPAISTDGLTTVDVGDLSVCVCEQMIKVSRDISDPSAQPPPHDEADKASANTGPRSRDSPNDKGLLVCIHAILCVGWLQQGTFHVSMSDI
jgi:hypothetical protein